MEGCAADGFDAVELDNLDSYSRSDGLVSQDDAVEFMAIVSVMAHSHGLAFAHKNATELTSRRAEMGTDFAVVAECNRWGDCQSFKDAYGELVFMIEHRPEDLAVGCEHFPELSIVLRDVLLAPAWGEGYIYETC